MALTKYTPKPKFAVYLALIEGITEYAPLEMVEGLKRISKIIVQIHFGPIVYNIPRSKKCNCEILSLSKWDKVTLKRQSIYLPQLPDVLRRLGNRKK